MINLQNSMDENIDKMSSLNHTVPKIMRLVNDINSSAHDIMKVIQMDPVLTGKVLKLVNSAYFGLRQEVTALQKAIIMLGINTIKHLALSSSVSGSFSFKDKSCKISSESFWRYSVGTAVLSQLIAKESKIPLKETDEFFVVGLLHSIGKAFLIQFYPNEYNVLIDLAAEKGCSMETIEAEEFGITHIEIGLRLAKKWRLPESIQNGIEFYTTPDLSQMKTTWALSAACSLIKENKIGFCGDHETIEIFDEVYQGLNLDSGQIFNIMNMKLNDELKKASQFIKVS